MATFNAKITGVDAIIRKINNAPKKVAEESTKPNSNVVTAYELMKPFKRINIFI